jgi:cytochrome b pre-mRNA-processing protein 3
MIRLPDPLASLLRSRRSAQTADKLYGAIVARARLAVFYQEFRVPDTLAGRFAVLSLHLFAVLYRLKRQGPEASALAQDLIDRFSADMETVLREVGVGDLSIPKKMRGLAASSAALLRSYDEAFANGDAALAAAIAKALPLEAKPAEDASFRLASYLTEVVRCLQAQSLSALKAGTLKFPEDSEASGQALGDWLHEHGD